MLGLVDKDRRAALDAVGLLRKGRRAHMVVVCVEGRCVALVEDLCRAAAGREIQRVKREGWKDILVISNARLRVVEE